MSQTQFLTMQQTADLLCVSKRTVESWVASGKLHARRLTPRVVRISQADLDRFVMSRPTAAS